MGLFVWVVVVLLGISSAHDFHAVVKDNLDSPTEGVAVGIRIALFAWGCVVLATAP